MRLSLPLLTPALLALQLAACSGSSDPEVVDPDVVVTHPITYLGRKGVVSRVEAFSEAVELLVPQGESYLRREATLVEAGRYVVPQVPETAFWVRVGSYYALTRAREVALQEVRPFDPDITFTDAEVGRVEVSGTGLAPWNEQSAPESLANDSLELISLEAGAAAHVRFDLEPVQGTTELQVAGGDLFSVGTPTLPRLDFSAGNLLAAVQITARDGGTVGGREVHYTAARTVAYHGNPYYTGTAYPMDLSRLEFQELPQQRIALDLRASAFASLLEQVHPEAFQVVTGVSLRPVSIASPQKFVSRPLTLLTYYQFAPDLADLATTFEYGHPFPPGLTAGRAWANYQLNVQLPSGMLGLVTATADMQDELLEDGFGARPLEPRILPPRNLRVDEQDAWTSRQLGSATPRVSWEAPEGDSVGAYQLELIELTQGRERFAEQRRAATFLLPPGERSMRMPPGLLQPGGHYVLRLAALRSTRWGLPLEPIAFPYPALRFPHDRAETLSGLLTAPGGPGTAQDPIAAH